jgi:hypothetical protein
MIFILKNIGGVLLENGGVLLKSGDVLVKRGHLLLESELISQFCLFWKGRAVNRITSF